MAAPAKPHLAFFLFPTQGHVTPAFQLATLLHHRHGFDVTFVHTEHNLRRLLRARGPPDALAGPPPGIRFVSVPDGLAPSDSDEDAAQDMAALHLSLPSMAPHFKELVLSSSELPAASCCLLVSDVDHILRAAEAIGMPRVTFWITAMQQGQRLVAEGLVPLKDA